MNKKNIYLVIPAYNEQQNLPQVLSKVRKIMKPKNVIIVDDGSEKPLKLPGKEFTLLRHKTNQGKGAAMHTGAKYAFSNKAEALIFMDADGQHDPEEIPKFMEKFISGYDMVFGSRMMPINTPLIRFLGNKFASMYVSLIFKIYLSDILSGYRGLSKKAYRELSWISTGYGVETEMIARLAKQKDKLKFTEFPILGIYLDANKGMSLTDAFKVLYDSLAWKIKFDLRTSGK